ncbi:hypothetical protein DPMN_174134 [Dreissena polymorpha]|uniref:Uncharacterized protein n=1 Tax=Dreissena polymorpha TaxID=45954 RepID=A0A9D4IIB0_DREPO|nr:hypothetical protein DPMN_174134 [Dreissena polymorpha]
MDYSHERFHRAGHGRRAASTIVIGPFVRALLGLPLTVFFRLGLDYDLQTTYSYHKTGHSRRAASTIVIGPWVCALWGAISVNGLPCFKLKHSTTPTAHYDNMIKRRKSTLSQIQRSLSPCNHYGLTTTDKLNSPFENH